MINYGNTNKIKKIDMKHIHTFEEFLNEAINEDQRFLNFRYGTGMDKIPISTIENFRKGKKTNKDFEKTAKHFGSISGVFVLTAKDPKDVKTITRGAKDAGVIGFWTIDNDKNDVFIVRGN